MPKEFERETSKNRVGASMRESNEEESERETERGLLCLGEPVVKSTTNN